MKRLAYIIPFAFLLSLFFPRCAIIEPPTGGLKDTIPPVLVRSTPALYATNYKRERVVLTFDEYIRLDKIGEKLVLSPPQEQLPEFKIRGKSIELKFFEPLYDSTTYTLYFADAIIDNNEGNKLENFEFAFSTGPEIDSLRFQGKIIDAFTLEPKGGVFVMLYNKFEDSIPLKERPRYVTKSNKEGEFFLSNLRNLNYKIFALEDGNSNYKFDQVSEAIAFLSTQIDTSMLLRPSQPKIDSDSLFTLRLFHEENRAISLTDFTRKQRRKLRLGFTRRPEGEVRLNPVNVEVDTTTDWYIKGSSVKGDSLDFWIINDEISRVDTLIVQASYLKTDSAMNLVQAKDTLRMFFFERSQTTSRRTRHDEEESEKVLSLPITTSIRKGANVIPVEVITLSFGMPLLKIDTSFVELKNLTDSLKMPSLGLSRDSLNPRLYRIENRWKPHIAYQLTALPGAFTNLDGLTNDTLAINFKGADPEQFGVIRINLTGVTPDVIVELLTDKGQVVDSKIIEKDQEVSFSYVKPAKYQVRFIKDLNRNGVWDTGWYLKGIQPEEVYFYFDSNNKDIQVRANWEYDLTFNLKTPKDVSSDELRDVPNEEEHQREPIRYEGSEGYTR